MKKEHRYKIIWIAQEVVISILTYGLEGRVLKAEGLPKKAKLINIYYDPLRSCFALVIEHKSFTPVKVGAIIPDLNNLVFTLR